MERSDSSHAAVLFFPKQAAVQIRLCGCAGSTGFSLFSWGVVTALTLQCFFSNRQQGPNQAAQMRRLICSHVAYVQLSFFSALFFFNRPQIQIRLRI